MCCQRRRTHFYSQPYINCNNISRLCDLMFISLFLNFFSYFDLCPGRIHIQSKSRRNLKSNQKKKGGAQTDFLTGHKAAAPAIRHYQRHCQLTCGLQRAAGSVWGSTWWAGDAVFPEWRAPSRASLHTCVPAASTIPTCLSRSSGVLLSCSVLQQHLRAGSIRHKE